MHHASESGKGLREPRDISMQMMECVAICGHCSLCSINKGYPSLEEQGCHVPFAIRRVVEGNLLAKLVSVKARSVAKAYGILNIPRAFERFVQENPKKGN
jgi:hypothetical protein